MAKNKIKEEVGKAIKWLSSEYYFFKELKENLEELKRDLSSAKEHASVKDIRKALRDFRYIGKSERKFERYELDIEKEAEKSMENYQPTFSGNMQELKHVMNQIHVEAANFIRVASFFEGEIRKRLLFLMDEVKDHQFEDAKRKLEELDNIVARSDEWIKALDISLAEARKVSEKYYEAPPRATSGTSRIDYNDPHGAGALGLSYHYEMVSDNKRVIPFRNALQRVCAGKRVFESGVGSGIMTILAAKAGARKVYAVDIDPKIIEIARRNVEKSGYENVIQLMHKNTLTVTPADLDGEKVDVVIAENLSTWQVTEPQIILMNHINENVAKTNAVRLPTTIFNYFELAQTKYHFQGAVNIRTHFFQFSGIRKPKVLSDRVLFTQIDMRKINSPQIEKKVRVTVGQNGTLNSLRLTSPLQVYEDITFDASDSLMPPIVIPLKEDLPVKKGDTVELEIKYKHNTSWEEISVTARVL